jgi:hypothetical protein
MQERNDLTRADNEMIDALGRLRPAAAGINRDELMFQAGRAAAGRGRWCWPCVSSALAVALCVSLAFHMASKPQSLTEPTWALVEDQHLTGLQADTAQSPAPAGDGQYVLLRNKVLERGLDNLPEPALSTVGAEDDRWLQTLPGYPRPKLQAAPQLKLWNLFVTGEGT